MQQTNNFTVLNIREYLVNEDGKLGEEKLRELLSEFSCPLNVDVQHFLRQQALNFQRSIRQLIFGTICGRYGIAGIFFHHDKTSCCESGSIQQYGKT